MGIQISYEKDCCLYLVPTPIGNLQDMTFRAIDVLKKSDIIYCEDTRTSLPLLRHYDIRTKLISLHEHNEENRIQEIKDNLDQGMSLSIISDAGMPNICDPGFKVVNELVSQGYSVVSLPGANACITALAASGMSTENFIFKGFFPKKQSNINKMLEELKKISASVVFYESCHRINKTLYKIYDKLGDVKIVIAREISKKFETYYRGNVSEFLDLEYKGELVIILELIKLDDVYDIDQMILERIDSMKSKELVKEVTEITNGNKNEIYKRYLELKEREN